MAGDLEISPDPSFTKRGGVKIRKEGGDVKIYKEGSKFGRYKRGEFEKFN